MAAFLYAAADTVPLWSVPVVAVLAALIVGLALFVWDVTHD